MPALTVPSPFKAGSRAPRDRTALGRVARGDLCAGCGACAAVAPGAISMQQDRAGYLRPVQTAEISPIQDGLIAAICPGLGQIADHSGGFVDPLWGACLTQHQAAATDPALRYAGASGGVLSALASWLIAAGHVQAVLHITADPDRAAGNIATLSRGYANILAAAGSRYAPAAPLAILPDLPTDLQRLAFIGKPCDAAALRALAAHDPAVAARFPVILSFFCAGTPSMVGADALLAALQTHPDEAATLRYRGHGWPGMARVTRKDGTTAAMSYQNSWGRILSRHLQHRCKICADGTGSLADIVCADAWASDKNGYPLFTEAEGQSLVIARTPFGADLLQQAIIAGALSLSGAAPPDLAVIQPGQRNRKQALLARLAALRLAGRPVPQYRGYQLRAAARQAPLMFHLRQFLGTLRRALWQVG